MSKVRPVRLVPGLRVDRVDGELIVLDEAARRVHRLRGPAADVVRRLEDGADVAFDDGATLRVVGALRAAGLVEGGVSRRGALGVAAAAASLGILTLSLPGAASAESGGGGPLSLTGGTEGVPEGALSPAVTAAAGYAYRTFTTPGANVLEVTGSGTIDVLIVSGGGGGGGGGGSSYGAGGGGGGQVSLLMGRSVTAGTFTVHVATGGSGGTLRGDGGAGSASYVTGIEDPGPAGGSGGEGGDTSTTPAGGASGATPGGNGIKSGPTASWGAGGGGAGADQGGRGAGGDARPSEGAGTYDTGGSAGAGYEIAGFFGANVYLGMAGSGGGYYGGSVRNPAAGGRGGYGDGEGAAWYGGGGGGGGGYERPRPGGAGAQGVVVIRHATP